MSARVILGEATIAGIPVQTAWSGHEIQISLAGHALDIPLPIEAAASLGRLLVSSVEKALLLNARDSVRPSDPTP